MSRYIFLFCIFFAGSIHAQHLVVQEQNKDCIPVLSQNEINKLLPTDGFVVFNSTTGCLNYWFAKSWKALCGDCEPAAKLPRIDSIVQIKNVANIYCNSFINDTILLLTKSSSTKFCKSPFTFSLPANDSVATFTIKISSPCGNLDTTISFFYKSYLSISALEYTSLNGMEVPIRKVNDTWWTCEDLKGSNKKIVLKSDEYLVNVVNNDAVCPVGWSLPSALDWKDLLDSYAGNYANIFQKANNNNTSLGLSKRGFYIRSENKRYFENETSYYWASDFENGKRKLVNITLNGFQILTEVPDEIYMPIRCIKHE